MLNKKLLENNSTKTKAEPNSNIQEPKAQSPKLLEENNSILPKPPKQTQASKKPFKSSLAKSLFESSSDEDEPLPNWMPSNNRSQTNSRLFDSDLEEDNKDISTGFKVPNAYVPNQIIANAYVPNQTIPNAYASNQTIPTPAPKNTIETNPTIVNDIEDTITVPASKLKNNINKVLPDLTQAKPLRKSSETNSNHSIDRDMSTNVPKQINKKKPSSEKPSEKPVAKPKVKSIFDDSDDDTGIETSKPTPQQTNVIPKSMKNGVPSQPKKKFVSLFDDDSEDDIIEPVPQKSKPIKSETSKVEPQHEVFCKETSKSKEFSNPPRKISKTQPVVVENPPEIVLSDDNSADLFVTNSNPKPTSNISTNSTKANTPKDTSKLENSKNSEKDIFNFNSTEKSKPKSTNKTVVSLFSDSDSEDDLFSIPKSKNKFDKIEDEDDLFTIPKSENKIDTIDSTVNKSSTVNHMSSSSDLFNDFSAKRNQEPSIQEEAITNSINPFNKSEVVNNISDVLDTSSDVPDKSLPDVNHKTDINHEVSKPPQLLKSSELTAKTNLLSSSSSLFSDDDNDPSENKLPSTSQDSEQVSKVSDAVVENTFLGKISQGNSNELVVEDTKEPLLNGENKIQDVSKAPNKLPNSTDGFDIFKSDKKESLGSKTLILFNSQDSDDDDLWDSEPKSRKPDSVTKSSEIISEKKIKDEVKEESLKTEDSQREKLEEKESEGINNEIRGENTLKREVYSIQDDDPLSVNNKNHSESKVEEKPLNQAESENNDLSTRKNIPDGEETCSVRKENAQNESPSTTTEPIEKPKDIAEIKKSLALFENDLPKSDKDVPINNKVASLVSSYSLSSESEPSSPLFPEDKSVRSVKVTPEAKFITKTDKDNVTSVVKKPGNL